MEFINSIFGYPLGWLMWLCYKIVSNYGIALIIFTLLTKLILFPLAIKQQKSSLRMARMQPKLEELQKKYGKNKEKYNEEMLKLYDEEKYNPMSGCLPMLIQFPILFGLIDVIYKPMTHIRRMSSSSQPILRPTTARLCPTPRSCWQFRGSVKILSPILMPWGRTSSPIFRA